GLEPVAPEWLLTEDRLAESERGLGGLAMDGLTEEDGHDIDLGVLDDLPPVGREPIDDEVAGHSLATLLVARGERGHADRSSEWRDVVERVERVPVGPCDPARTQQPDADRVRHVPS